MQEGVGPETELEPVISPVHRDALEVTHGGFAGAGVAAERREVVLADQMPRPPPASPRGPGSDAWCHTNAASNGSGTEPTLMR